MAKAVERLKRPASPRAWRPETGPCLCAAMPAPSGPTCDGAATRRKTRSWPSTPRWSASPPTPCAKRASVARNARRALRRLGTAAPPKLEAVARDLEVTAERVAQIARQTRQRLAGVVPDGATRLVSLHDPDARPIRKGRLGKPVEFGYKAQVLDNEDGVDPRLQRRDRQPARRPDARTGRPNASPGALRVPMAVTADRGYGEVGVEDELNEHRRARGRSPDQRQTQRRPAAAREPSRASKSSCGGGPDAKDGSAASNVTSAGTGHASTASRGPGPGAVTGCSTTTW